MASACFDPRKVIPFWRVNFQLFYFILFYHFLFYENNYNQFLINRELKDFKNYKTQKKKAWNMLLLIQELKKG